MSDCMHTLHRSRTDHTTHLNAGGHCIDGRTSLCMSYSHVLQASLGHRFLHHALDVLACAHVRMACRVNIALLIPHSGGFSRSLCVKDGKAGLSSGDDDFTQSKHLLVPATTRRDWSRFTHVQDTPRPVSFKHQQQVE